MTFPPRTWRLAVVAALTAAILVGALWPVLLPYVAATRLRGLGLNVQRGENSAYSVEMFAGESFVTEDTMAWVARLREVEAFYSQNIPLTDAGVVHLARVSKLRMLVIDNGKITDVGLKGAGVHPDLYLLELMNCLISDQGLVDVARQFPNLQRLSLNDTFVTGRELQGLRLLPLTWLDLRSTPFADAGCAHVGSAGTLESLLLSNTQITDAGAARLGGLHSLRVLDLRDTKTGDEAARVLAQLPALESLRMGHTALTDAGLRRLAKAPRLQHLDMEQTRVTDAGLAPLAESPSLFSVSLLGVAVTDVGLTALAKAPAMEHAWLELGSNKALEVLLDRSTGRWKASLERWDREVVEADLKAFKRRFPSIVLE